jgi:nitroimidazol reductase NimA-like FMN-containing flavoprotein (pyridoxamine 5'-phosphate oxidase superfamily)
MGDMKLNTSAVMQVRRSLRNAAEATAAVALDVLERRQLSESLLADAAPGQLRELTNQECAQLLHEESVGRLAYIARAGTPDIAVVNYSFDGRDVFVRSGPGPKLQAAERGDRVVLEVDVLDPARRAGRSVVVHGRASRVPSAPARAEDLELSPWAAGPRRHLIRIRPARITGRCVS